MLVVRRTFADGWSSVDEESRTFHACVDEQRFIFIVRRVFAFSRIHLKSFRLTDRLTFINLMRLSNDTSNVLFFFAVHALE